jgi:hypothetical protein
MRFERRVIKLRAIAFGVYPSSCAARSTRARIFGLALEPGLKHRETADCDTPARFATSYDVACDAGEISAGFVGDLEAAFFFGMG